MSAGKVELLIMLGGNPAFDAPADFDFAQRLTRVKTRVHFGSHVNETAVLCEWHIPAAHELESWSDARAFDGTASIIQPLIEPLYGGKTAHELLAAMLGEPNPSSYEIVRSYWQRASRDLWPDFESRWRTALQDGLAAGTESEPTWPENGPHPLEVPAQTERNEGGLEVVFRADPSAY